MIHCLLPWPLWCGCSKDCKLLSVPHLRPLKTTFPRPFLWRCFPWWWIQRAWGFSVDHWCWSGRYAPRSLRRATESRCLGCGLWWWTSWGCLRSWEDTCFHHQPGIVRWIGPPITEAEALFWYIASHHAANWRHQSIHVKSFPSAVHHLRLSKGNE